MIVGGVIVGGEIVIVGGEIVIVGRCYRYLVCNAGDMLVVRHLSRESE